LKRRILLLITFIGIALLLLAGYAFMRQIEFQGRAETALATLEKYSVRAGTEGETYCPIFVFTRSDGLTVVYYGDVCASPPAYEIGQQVEVLYDPLEDRGVQLNTFRSKYRDVFVPFGIGLPLFLLGLFGMRSLRSRSIAGRQG
jgi:hypothetical protein